MSATGQQTPVEVLQAVADAEAEEAAEEEALVTLTLDEAVENIDDGSRTAEGVSFSALVESITEKMVAVKVALISHTQARKDAAAAIAAAARSILLPSGIPDWALDSKASQTVLHYSLDKVLDSLDTDKGERKRERNAIMAHYTRSTRDLEMRSYVAETSTQLDANGETLKLFPDGPDDTNDLFLAHVRKQYVASGVGIKAMPSKYRTPEDKQTLQPGGGGPGQGPANAMEAVAKGIDSLKGIAARYAAVALLKGVSSFVRAIAKHEVQYGTEQDKQAVSEILARIGAISYYGRKAVDGVTSGDEAEEVLSLFWSSEDETFDK